MARPDDLGLGRRFLPDPGDDAFPIRLAAPHQLTARQQAAIDRGWAYWWADGAWVYQGRTGTCVPHAWWHWLADGPVTYDGPPLDPIDLYRAMVLLDGFAENDAEANGPRDGMQFGTTVRAGAKLLQRRGLIGAYRWGRTIDVLIRTLLTEGPVVMGTVWTDGMFDWTSEGVIHYDGKRDDQGHAYVANGINLKQGLIRIKPWGHKGIGRNGHLYLPLEDAERLIRDDGEVCLAEEPDRPVQPTS